MALRQLATGAGDGCSSDGAGGSGDASAVGPSNPLGGLADALLGRSSKAHERAHEVRLANGCFGSVRGRESSEETSLSSVDRRTNAPLLKSKEKKTQPRPSSLSQTSPQTTKKTSSPAWDGPCQEQEGCISRVTQLLPSPRPKVKK